MERYFMFFSHFLLSYTSSLGTMDGSEHRSRNVMLIICFALHHCYSSFIHRVDLVESPKLAAFAITLTQVQILTVCLSPSFHAFPRKNVNDHSILLKVPKLLMNGRAFLRAVLQNHLFLSDIKAQLLWATEENLLPAGVLQVLLLPVVTARG